MRLAFPGLEPQAALAWTLGHSGPGEEGKEGLRGDLAAWLPASWWLHLQRAERSQEPETEIPAFPSFQTAMSLPDSCWCQPQDTHMRVQGPPYVCPPRQAVKTVTVPHERCNPWSLQNHHIKIKKALGPISQT